MTNWIERSFDLVAEITKQVLTLSTAIIALSVTFLGDFEESMGSWERGLLTASWSLFSLAIITGLATLMALAGVQDKYGRVESNQETPSIYRRNIRNMGGLQLATFVGGVVVLAVAGVIALF